MFLYIDGNSTNGTKYISLISLGHENTEVQIANCILIVMNCEKKTLYNHGKSKVSSMLRLHVEIFETQFWL